MSKLIVEMEMNGIPDCCGLCDPLFTVVCATKHDQTIDKMMLRAGRPSWCPIIGVLPEQHGDLVDADTVLWEVPDSEGIVPPMPVTIGDVIEGYDVPIVIAAERKDDGN